MSGDVAPVFRPQALAALNRLALAYDDRVASARHATARNQLLAGLGVADRELLLPHLKPVELRLNEVLLRVGQRVEHVTFVERGVVSHLADAGTGRVEVGMIGREGLVGLPVVLGVARAAHTSVVHEAGEALRIRSQDLQSAMDESPAMQARLLRYAHAFLVQVSQTAYAHADAVIEMRVARCILMTADRTDRKTLALTHDLLALKLGVRRPGVTTAVQVLEGKGLIRATRGCIVIRDRAGLQAAAGAAYGLAEAEYDIFMRAEPE